MRLYLLGKDKLEYIEVPEKVESNISITKFFSSMKNYSFNIDSIDNNLYIKSNSRLKLYKDKILTDKAILEPFNYYVMNISGTQNNILLYTLPINDTNTYSLDITNTKKITVGSSEACDIIYNQASFTIEKQETENISTWELTNSNPENKIYVNNISVDKCILKVGDIIFANGLRIIWMNKFLNVNNPKGTVHVQKLNSYQTQIKNTTYTQNNDEIEEINLYNENDYFYHTLRMDQDPEIVQIEIEQVPATQIKEELPFILSIGTSFTMVASSFMSGFTIYLGLSTGNRSVISYIPQMVMIVAMIVGSLLIPRLANRYQKKKAREREEQRQKQYTAYLAEKETEINNIKKQQEETLRDNNPSCLDCYKMVTDANKINNIRFWNRIITDKDFLTVRLGSGTCKSKIELTAPQKHFTLDKDTLFEKSIELAENSKYLHNIPITISLIENNKTGIIINNTYQQDYINSLIMQIAALHSPSELKIVVLTNKQNEKNWDYIKYLPHVWSSDKEKRFFATTTDEINELSSILEEEYKTRKNNNSKNETQEGAEKAEVTKEETYRKYDTYYLVINDDYNLAKNSIIVDLLTKTSINFGFSYLCIGNKIKELPSMCNAFIEITEKTGIIIDNDEIPEKRLVKFTNEFMQNANMRMFSDKLANIPIITSEGLSVLPNTLNFLEMLKASKIEQLDIPTRWKNNNPVVSLATTIGVHTNGEDFKLDLHEKFHGPHGLIAGSTGSGKSEFIITYILSMAVNYHPYEVQFVLIDYKGGGLAGAFENKETGVKIPHLIGTITNLDTAEMNRTLVSIESELKRRQRIFNEVRDQLDEGTIDIYKYQRLYREGVVSEPMAHLFIISDEFAELKQQQPDFMQQLIQTARIGRSLGVHLILATQKPSGVVNDQIWSNSKFKVCLKVQDRSDSMEMLKRPEAASIKETGRFYLQVGYDDYFDIGQSGWSGAKYVPSDRIIKKVDDSLNFVNNVGYPVKTIKDIIKVEQTEDLGEQLTNVVKYIYDLSEKENIKTHKLWLDALASEIYLSNLKKKYNYKPSSYYINPVIGEYDNPGSQEQGILNLDISKGNTLIYGQTGSGKELLLSTIIWSTMAEHTPDEVNMYVIDCGAETLKMFNNIPHVGEIATIEDTDLIHDIFEMLNKEIEKRKELFKDYAGSYKDYIENSGKKLPLILTVINNYEIFVENFGKLSDEIQTLYRDGSKYGIMFIISAVATNAIRSRMAQNFVNNICLQIPNTDEYRSILHAPRGLFPSKIFGRGLVAKDDTAYEFQTAMFAPRKDMTNVVRSVSDQLNSAYKTRAKKIPVIPKVIKLDNLLKEEYDIDNIPVGYDIVSKQEKRYNFKQPIIPIVTNEMTIDRFEFIKAIVELIINKCKNVRIIDFEKIFEKQDDIVLYNDDFNKALVEINNEVMKKKNNNEEYYYIFLGIGKIRKVLTNDGLAVLNNILTNLDGIINCHMILVDVYESYKNLQIEPWYQIAVNPMNGIWLGNQAENQLVINIPKLTMDEKKLNFIYQAFLVTDGNHSIIKHVIKEGKNEE